MFPSLNQNTIQSNFLLKRITDAHNDQEQKITENKTEITELNENVTNLNLQTQSFSIKSEVETEDVQSRFFSDVYMAYYDFSDENFIGRDYGGNNCHFRTDTKLQQDVDLDDRDENGEKIKPRYSVSFTDIGYRGNYSYDNVVSNVEKLETDDVDILKTFKTLSFWFYNDISANDYGTLISFSDNERPNSYFSISVFEQTRISMDFVIDGIVVFDAKTAVDTAPQNQWVFVSFQTRSSGSPELNKLIIGKNGPGSAPLTQDINAGIIYDTINDENLYINLSGTETNSVEKTLKTTHITLGARKLTVEESNPNVTNKSYTHVYHGKIAQLCFFNRYLTYPEVRFLSELKLGYYAIILGGQSNMVGNANGTGAREAIDEDYSLFENRVFQFKTDTNINLSNLTLDNSVIEKAQHPLAHWQSVPENTGPWKSLCDDLIQYSNIPYDLDILLIPCARSARPITDWIDGIAPDFGGAAILAANTVLNPSVNARNNFNKLAFLLWSQGESDIADENSEYAANFITLITNFENNIFGFSDAKIITTEISGHYDSFVINNSSAKQFINNIFENLSLTNPARYGFVRTQGLKYSDDGLHYDIQSTRQVGYLFYQKMAEMAQFIDRKPRNNELIVVKNNEVNYNGKHTFENIVCNFQNPPTNLLATNLTLNAYYEKTYTFDITNTDTSNGDKYPTCKMHFVRMGGLVFCNIYGFRIRIGSVEADRDAVNINSYDPSFNVINPIDDVFLFKNESGKSDLYNTMKFVGMGVRFIKGPEISEPDDSLTLYFRFDSTNGGVRLMVENLYFSNTLEEENGTVVTNGFENNATYITTGGSFSWVAK